MAKTTNVKTGHKNSFFLWIHAAFLGSSLLIVIPVALTMVFQGKSAAEKYLTAAAQPMFLLCFTLLSLGLVLFWRDQRGAARLLWLIVACTWICSCTLVRNEIYRRWEQQIPFTSLDELQPYDYVVVLGGGTGSRPDGFPQFGEAGDRAALAARLFHRGLAKRLVTTGDTIRMADSFGGGFLESDAPANQTASLWQELKVPADRIEKLGGENTISEMRELAQHPEWWKDKRCGIITSAFHMPRSMRLAKQSGIRADPIPSHFRTSPKHRPTSADDFLPKADKLADLHDLLKEWMAGLVGR